MAKFPREEISYRKLYRKLDIEKDLNIEWPKVSYPSETVIVDEEKETFIEEQEAQFDEYDGEFCSSNSINRMLFKRVFQMLDCNYISHVFKEIDSIKAFKGKLPCDICGKFDLKDSQLLLTCQGCGISVHEECYGIPEIPENAWLCKKCIFYFEEAECKFCNKKDGIMKKTDSNEWGHVICALLNPGLTFCNINIRDPIDTVDLVCLQGKCSICGVDSSTLIQCSFDSCSRAYHASCCAEEFYCDLNNKFTYCASHNPLVKHKKVLSKRNMLRITDSYPGMNEDVFLRKPMPLAVPIKTKYLEIVTGEPFVIDNGIDESNGDAKSIKMIKEYWTDKRRSLGFYFDDIFMFSNYFMSLDK